MRYCSGLINNIVICVYTLNLCSFASLINEGMKIFKLLSTAALLKKQGMKMVKHLSPAALKKRRYRERRDLRETEQEHNERLQADSDRKRAEYQRKKARELEDIRRALSFDSGELPDPASHSAMMKENIATAMKQAKQVLHRKKQDWGDFGGRYAQKLNSPHLTARNLAAGQKIWPRPDFWPLGNLAGGQIFYGG